MELITQVVPLCRSVCVPSTASILVPGYTAFTRYVIFYISHLLTHVVDMRYDYNSWNLKELKDELKKEINTVRACKEQNYDTVPSCVLAPSSDHVGSQFL